MTIERQILLTLSEAGPNGMPLRHIALHVYNRCNTLFQPLDRQTVYKQVGAYLRSTVKHKDALVRKGDVRGWYRLNRRSRQWAQMQMQFQVCEEDHWMM